MSKFTIQFKQYWKNFGSYNKMRFVKSGMYFFVGALGLILLSAFSQKLSMLDIGLAKWAQANASNDHSSLFNTGAIQFVNEKQTPIFWMAFSFLVILFGFDLIVLRLKFKEHLMKYLYIICSTLAFVAISTILVQAMKFSFHRPRPTHTVDYHSPFDTDLSCKLAFHIAFRVYKGPNPCDYSLQSCPSGHVQGTATSCFVMLWFALAIIRINRVKILLNYCIYYELSQFETQTNQYVVQCMKVHDAINVKVFLNGQRTQSYSIWIMTSQIIRLEFTCKSTIKSLLWFLQSDTFCKIKYVLFSGNVRFNLTFCIFSKTFNARHWSCKVGSSECI
ncbi:PAP2_superfamily protein [Hexamita inflata]|uniref:PAP2 superfamily protein n=1 Tax=Hexamita inflata TaxID=28002 RepID=A0AA86TQ68_9EUKA|nr:PAP2 superfamily protein [Hexamita inflata]